MRIVQNEAKIKPSLLQVSLIGAGRIVVIENPLALN